MLSAVSMVLFALAPSFACAAPAARSIAASAPVAVPSLEVQVWAGGEPGQSVVIVSAIVADSVALPVTVRVPVPEGAQVVWAGEILGGDPTADPSKPYEIVEGGGGKVVQFELSQSRQAQVEFNGFPLDVSGSKATGRIGWIQSAEASETGFSVRFPLNATGVKTTPAASGTPQKNSTGETLYTLPSKILKPGSRMTVEFSYSTGAPATASGANGSSTVLIVLGAAMAMALAALAFLLLRRRAIP